MSVTAVTTVTAVTGLPYSHRVRAWWRVQFYRLFRLTNLHLYLEVTVVTQVTLLKRLMFLRYRCYRDRSQGGNALAIGQRSASRSVFNARERVRWKIPSFLLIRQRASVWHSSCAAALRVRRMHCPPIIIETVLEFSKLKIQPTMQPTVRRCADAILSTRK